MKFKESLLSNEYALLGLTSFHAQEQLKLSATSTAQPKLNKDDVKEIWLALPTQLSEQNQILNYVNGQKHAFDSLIEQAKLGIELLQERRSALISAAVTGQIDLRNFQSRESHDS
jgi:type I restriction enzyme S subunit